MGGQPYVLTYALSDNQKRHFPVFPISQNINPVISRLHGTFIFGENGKLGKKPPNRMNQALIRAPSRYNLMGKAGKREKQTGKPVCPLSISAVYAL